MLIVAACISSPAQPWLPLMGMLGVACIIIAAQAVVPPTRSGVQLAVRCGFLLWIFVLPAMGVLQVGITSRNMPLWAASSPLYWLGLLFFR